MTTLQLAQEYFHNTRVIAIDRYRRWKKHEHEQGTRKDYYLNECIKAYVEHEQASRELFLLECEEHSSNA